MSALDLDRILETARAALPLAHGSNPLYPSLRGLLSTVIALVERLREAEARLTILGGRCLDGITLRDGEHRQAVCILAADHREAHDDGLGCAWTDGEHWEASAEDRLAAVDGLHVSTPGSWCCPTCDDCCQSWPCQTHLAVHPECEGECSHGSA